MEAIIPFHVEGAAEHSGGQRSQDPETRVLLMAGYLVARLSSLWPVSQTIHHLSEATPSDSLSLMTTSAIPKERATAENKRADLLPGRINLQVQRRPGFRQFHHLRS